MRFNGPVLAALTAAALLSPAIALPAQAAAPTVLISRIYYDSPGTDTRSNTSLNGEYIVLRNNTRRPVNLKDWSVRDASVAKYTFEGDFLLGAGKTVTLRTGPGRDGSTQRYWNWGAYVWNNTGADGGYLRNATGRLIDSCTYRGSRNAYVNC